MPRTVVEWEWEDAFSKFGFEDGDGWNGTNIVCHAIDALGYNTVPDGWGCHNYLIMDIEKDGKSILFDDVRGSWNAETVARMTKNGVTDISDSFIGYTDPHLFLPDDILEVLNATFTDDYEVVA
jgi:hypothetical protein